MVREMRALYEAGELDAAQRQWFEPPGAERLFDLENDPHELVDLSRDPTHAAVLARLGGALDAWLSSIVDTSEEPEDRMAERFWPGGEQPVTSAPILEVEDDMLRATGGAGARVGFRLDDGPWQLYTGPVPVPPGARIEARAVRYGWQESPTVSLATP